MEADGSRPASDPVRWRFASAEFNERTHALTVDGESVALEPKPLEVLLCLLRAEGELVTKQELFETVWAGRVVTDGVLSQAIRRIREVLGDGDRTMLRTVHGYGFRLDVPIEIEGRDDPGTRLDLETGGSLPNLPDWILDERLQTRPANELWRIRHARNGNFRVVKLALDERATRALKREVTLNKVLINELGDGAPLVPLLEWQFDSSPAWIQMPWYERGSLADWIRDHGGAKALDMRRRCRIVAEAAEALAKAHALGVMHKDIKPGNLLVSHDGSEPRLLLCDFGSGTVKSRDRLDQAGVTVMGFTQTIRSDPSTSGTPAYMAPEVLKGGVFSEQSDVYSVGILLYQLVVGDLSEPMAAGWEEDVEDEGLRAIIAAACAGKPSRRIGSMAELAQRVRAWRPGQAAGDGAEPAPNQVGRRRRSLAIAAAALLAVALSAWIGTTAWLPGEEPSATPETVAGAPSAPVGNRVAILAFELLGLDEQTQTIMAGLQDALVTDLAGLSGVRLVHGQNLAALGLEGASPARIGRTLRVGRLIRGSVQQAGELLRVNLQILDSDRGETIWGQAVQGSRGDLFAVQNQIARTLADGLGTSLAAGSGAGPSVSNTAYEAYLAALSYWKQGLYGEERSQAFVEQLELALAEDPDFIDAHLLALLNAARNYWMSAATRDESEALIAGHLAALERQDTPPVKLATARAVRRYYLEHDPAGGVEILAPFRRMLLQNSESALFYAYMLRRVGRADEAIEILDAVAEQDPSTTVPLDTKAEVLSYQGKTGEAFRLMLDSAERTANPKKMRPKMAMWGYTLTGDLRFSEVAGEAAEGAKDKDGLQHYFAFQAALHDGDRETMLRLARELDEKDGWGSGHARTPAELHTAVALAVAGAPDEEVRAAAATALGKLDAWRAESDSDARRGAAAVTLALLGRGEAAVELIRRIEAANPLERDQLESVDRLHETMVAHALLGNEQAVLERLEVLTQARFIGPAICAIPYRLDTRLIWRIDAVRERITAICEPVWARNRAEMAPVLQELLG